MRIMRVSHGHVPRPSLSPTTVHKGAQRHVNNTNDGRRIAVVVEKWAWQAANCNRDKFASFFVAVIKKRRQAEHAQGKGAGGVSLRWGRCHCCWQACQGELGGQGAAQSALAPPN